MSSDWREAEKEYEDKVTGWNTVPEAIDEAAGRRPDADASMYKGGVYERTLVPEVIDEAPEGEFASLTYGEFRDLYRRLAAGFDALGVEKGDRVGVFSDTRIEWALSDFALLSRGATVTSVYSSSSPRQTRYLLEDPDASGVIVENQELLERVLEVEDELELDFIVVMDEVDDSHLGRDNVHTLADVYKLGEESYDEGTFEGWLDELEIDDL